MNETIFQFIFINKLLYKTITFTEYAKSYFTHLEYNGKLIGILL